MMTLDEAIQHAYEVFRTCDDPECALEHWQLYLWLRDYKDCIRENGRLRKMNDEIEVGS